MTTSPVMDWLAQGVPLTLLCDLTSTQDPPSHAIYLDESPPTLLATPTTFTTDHPQVAGGEAV